MTPDGRWLAATWPFVNAHLPPPPARVVDVGCGPHGGFVPTLRAAGYDAIGIDPKAPDEPHYLRTEVERVRLPRPVDAVVASTSLHHVTNPAQVIDQLVDALTADGVFVVVEWASERFDAKTAAWCFERLRAEGDPGWLRRRRDEWLASGDDWPTYLRAWTEQERLHTGEALVRHLEERLERRHLAHGPYFFADLADTTEAEEREAIDAGEIQAARIEYVGTPG